VYLFNGDPEKGETKVSRTRAYIAKKLDRQWVSFYEKLSETKKRLAEITYSSESLGQEWARAFTDGRGLDYQERQRVRALIEADIFLLPTTRAFVSVEDCFEAPPLPTYPEIPPSPPIRLAHDSEYEGWQLERTLRSHLDSDPRYRQIAEKLRELRLGGVDGDQKIFSALDVDIARRTLMLDEAAMIRGDIQRLKDLHAEEKRRFELYLSDCRRHLAAGSPHGVVQMLKLAHERNLLPSALYSDIEAHIDSDRGVIVVEYEFPDYRRSLIRIGTYKDGSAKYAGKAEKKTLATKCLYSLTIRLACIAARYQYGGLYQTVVINARQKWFDPATGRPRSGIIASLSARINELLELDLSKIDPIVCFRFLKGIATPSIETVSEVRPIFTLNKDDERLVKTRDVDARLAGNENLALMDWDAFEHLVAQLFEWEFKKNGIEVRVTRASRDRGVDAILFDPDPLRGGKYVIQAKRYTRTVDVSAVRDLFGTVMNEGANRGILITTATFGPDAYDFAKDKPISLVDGSNLLIMLEKHGRSFRIDLEEARRFLAEEKNEN